MNWLQELVQNRVLILTITAWLTAQVIKTLLHLFTAKTFRAERLIGAGGMPSAHSASVCALIVGVGRQLGLDSPVFAVTVLMGIIVMYDAMGVRRAAGLHARVLNQILSHDGEEEKPAQPHTALKESLGHTPLEVTAGAALGILIGVLFPM